MLTPFKTIISEAYVIVPKSIADIKKLGFEPDITDDIVNLFT